MAACSGGSHHGPARVCANCFTQGQRDARAKGREEMRDELGYLALVGRRLLNAFLPELAADTGFEAHVFEPTSEAGAQAACCVCNKTPLEHYTPDLDVIGERIDDLIGTSTVAGG